MDGVGDIPLSVTTTRAPAVLKVDLEGLNQGWNWVYSRTELFPNLNRLINENGANSANNNLPIQNMTKAISFQSPDYMNKSRHVICYMYALHVQVIQNVQLSFTCNQAWDICLPILQIGHLIHLDRLIEQICWESGGTLAIRRNISE